MCDYGHHRAVGVEDERRVAREVCDLRQLIATPEKSLLQIAKTVNAYRIRQMHADTDACVRACTCKLGVLYVTMRNLRVVRRLFAGR